MRLLYFIFLLLTSITSFAQHSITGKVIDLYNKKPIPKASVFLSNTTVGGSTGEDGSFNLTNVKPGQYDMIVSAIGYETFQRTILINGKLEIPFTELTPKTIALNAVVVKPDPERERNYNMFKREFFGPTEFALQCNILNPEVLDLSYSRADQMLSASSSDYLEIENKALGYKLKYKLLDFNRDYRSGLFFYMGNVLFEPMKGKPSQMRKWYKNRLEAYLGSLEHYLRSILSNLNTQEGFKTLQLIRKLNPDRPSDSLIEVKLKKFRPANTMNNRIVISDSLNYWSAKSRLPKYTEYLVTTPLRVDTMIRRTDQKGIFALAYKDILYVLYTKKKSDNSYNNTLMNAPDNLTSLMDIKAPYIFFDNNGVIINPTAMIVEGHWGASRVANLLPVDYDPREKDLNNFRNK